MDKVSVVIPTYNRKSSLNRAVGCALYQDYEGEIEIIIVDDSEERNDDFDDMELPKNRKIKYIHLKNKELGAPHARNIGIFTSTGDFIAFLDDDDYWYIDKISKQMIIMKKYKDCPLVTCYSKDKRYGKTFIDKPPEVISQKEILNNLNYSSTSAYLVRKYHLVLEKGFDEELVSAQEDELAIRLTKYHKARCFPDILFVQNISPNQISEDKERKVKGLKQVYKKHRDAFRQASIINPLKVLMACILLKSNFSGDLIRWFKKN